MFSHFLHHWRFEEKKNVENKSYNAMGYSPATTQVKRFVLNVESFPKKLSRKLQLH